MLSNTVCLTAWCSTKRLCAAVNYLAAFGTVAVPFNNCRKLSLPLTYRFDLLDDSSSEVDCVAAAAVAKGKAGKVFPEGLFAKYMCRTSKLLHLKPLDVQGDKLRCGRKLSLNFQLISSEHANLLLGCAQCFTE